jgi:hypothetical protein
VTYYLRAAGWLAFGGDYGRVARYLRLTQEEREFFASFWEPSFDAPLARPDMLVWGGGAALLESNVCSSIGGYSHEHLRAYFAEHPVWAEIGDELDVRIPTPYDGIATMLRRRQPGAIGMIDVPDVAGTEPDREGVNMRRFLAERGVSVAYERKAPPLFERRAVTVAGKRVDAIYRKFRGTFLLQSKRLQPLRELVRRGRVRLLFSPLDRLVADKQLLALLSDPETNQFIPAAHRGVVERAIPWTRLVRSRACSFRGRRWDMPRLSRERRRDLVLKRGEGAGGAGVFVGVICTDDGWEQVVRRALGEESWIVQEVVRRPLRRVPAVVDGRIVDYVNIPVDCPFLVDGHRWGGLTKMSGYYAGSVATPSYRAVPVAAPIALLGARSETGVSTPELQMGATRRNPLGAGRRLASVLRKRPRT